jgi:hypothetical protein
MYAIYGNIYHQYTPNVSIYTIHGDLDQHGSTYGIDNTSPQPEPEELPGKGKVKGLQLKTKED